MKIKEEPIHTHRNRILYFFLIIATIAAGLVSRAEVIPSILYPYLGDFLYALMVYWIMAFLFPGKRPLQVALLTVAVCFLIEISQLYHAEWIDAIRTTKLGGLILGYGFLWSDLLSYLAGGILGMTLEYIFLQRQG